MIERRLNQAPQIPLAMGLDWYNFHAGVPFRYSQLNPTYCRLPIIVDAYRHHQYEIHFNMAS